MKKLLFLFLALSLMHCQVEDYTNLIPGEKEKAESKKERENALNCIISTALCVQMVINSGNRLLNTPESYCRDSPSVRIPCWGKAGF